MAGRLSSSQSTIGLLRALRTCFTKQQQQQQCSAASASMATLIVPSAAAASSGSGTLRLDAQRSTLPVHLRQQHQHRWPPSALQQQQQQLISRGYAKAAKGKGGGGGGGGKKGGAARGGGGGGGDEDEDEGGAAAAADDFELAKFEPAMAAAVEHLQHELAGVRTGRANPGLLENIPVDAHGERVPLKAVGAVLVRNAQTLAVSVYDATLVGAVAKAIQNSPLGLAPAPEGTEVLVKLPRLTQDAVERLVKLVHLEAEGALQSVRRARQRALDAAKRAFKGGSEDARRRAEKDVQRLHDKYAAEVERLKKAKDAELREHRD